MNIKVSIVVPIYNVEKYLKECLNSIISQTYTDIEILMINDGSTDSSEKIAKMFSDIDPRFILINQSNKGLGETRNNGINLAKGDFILFIDSDDFLINNNSIENMVKIGNSFNAEIVAGKLVRYLRKNEYLSNSVDFTELKKNYYSGEEFLRLLGLCNWVPSCLYLYKVSYLRSNKLFFKKGILHEDEEFTPRVLLNAKKICIYNNEFYGYRQMREGSITNTISKKNIRDIINIMLELETVYDNIKDNRTKTLLKERSVLKIMDAIYNYNFLDIDTVTKNFLLRNSRSIKCKINALLIGISPKIYFKKEVLKYKLSIQ